MTISLIWGAPSQGKTYYATLQAILALLEGKRVFSNYPIVFTEPLKIRQKFINLLYWILRKKPRYIAKEYSTLKWEDEYMYSSLVDCTIILDEAYRYYSSHKRSVEDEVHIFFATNGHAGIDIFLIAQHYNRINLTIREMASYYIWIEKINNPFSNILTKSNNPRKNELTPLFFNAMTYISEEDFKRRWIKETIWKHERIWFSSKVANAYNTTYFKGIEKPIRPIKWSELLKNKKIEDVDFKAGLELMG